MIATATEAPETGPFVCPPDHPHGKNNTCRSGHRCRCADCREGQRLRMKERRKQIAYGRHEFKRSPAPVRRHIDELRGAGWTIRDISRASGVRIQTISLVARGKSGMVTPETFKRLIAVDVHAQPTPDRGAQLVDARGTVRRVQALIALGYSGADILRRIDVNTVYISRLMSSTQVQEKTRRKVYALYEELWDQPPTASNGYERAIIHRTQKLAQKRGWHPPLAWDDIDTDLQPPEVEVDDVPYVDDIKVERALDGKPAELNFHERRAAVRLGHARRWTDGFIAMRVSLRPETVRRIRAELRLEPWPYEETAQYQDGLVA